MRREVRSSSSQRLNTSMNQNEQVKRFHAGNLTDGWRWFGAHPAHEDGQDGWRFRVWAPNARTVSVVGEFNEWDLNAQPMVCGADSFEMENGTYFEFDGGGRITDVLYNLHTPRGYRGLEVYLLSTRLLLELVDECAAHDLFSWRRDVLQAKKDTLKLRSYVWGGFAAQIRSVKEYYDRSMTPSAGRSCRWCFWRTTGSLWRSG